MAKNVGHQHAVFQKYCPQPVPAPKISLNLSPTIQKRKTAKKSANKKQVKQIKKLLDLTHKTVYYSACYSGIVQSVEQRTVNPYVTGSSPVARATIYRRFLRFFFTFTAATCSGIKSQKSSKNTYFLYILYTILYYFYIRLFYIIYITTSTPRFSRASEDLTHPRHTESASVCHQCKIVIFTQKSTHYTVLTHRSLVRVSASQKSPDFWDFYFLLTYGFLYPLYDFVYTIPIFYIFGIHYGIQKSNFLFIHFYTVFIHGRNLRSPAHCLLNDIQNTTPYVIF